MNVIAVKKAGSIGSLREAPNVQIVITEEIWDDCTTHELEATFERDARVLAAALYAALPGGTLDRLTAILLAQKAGMLRVSYRDAGLLSHEEEHDPDDQHHGADRKHNP